ncbi:MAG: TIGR00366 family protein [Desulfitobacteriaceae bacterium]|nr:TIGR00366 family protein [Desulfitobacteriaceae bacterium]MDI6915812.1 TIGR00366 family protein [Desulfitobacteriaceae bacterium]
MSNDGMERRPTSNFMTRFANWSLRWVPDAMVFVLALSVIVYFMAMFLTPHGPIQIIDDWVQGFWALLTFSMQMTILMVSAFVVADSVWVKRGLKRLASIPKTSGQALLFFGFIVAILWYLHWGVGMMASIMLGKELVLAQKGKGIHYVQIVAMAYVGIVAANGPSMAAQLMVATPGHFMEKTIGIIPLSQTTFDVHLLILQLLLIVTLPLLIFMLRPKAGEAVEIDPALAESFAQQHEEPGIEPKSLVPAQRWERSPVFMWIIGLAGLVWVIKFFFTKGIANLDLNTLNFTFIILGMLLQGTPHNFIESVKRATGTVYGVIIQFPFYAGIFGMISYSGLAKVIAEFFVSISTAYSYPWIVFVYSGFLNFFVPSGGSKFVIEAPYILPAAQKLGANLSSVINAYTAGDLWTNVLQPFWALPILGAFKVKFREILPYGLIVFVWVGILTSAAFLLFPLWF